MKNFIEVTVSGNKMLINVNQIITVKSANLNSIKEKENRCFIDITSVKEGKSLQQNVEETYDQVKKLIEQAV